MKIDSKISVNEIIKRYPNTLPVLNVYGIDTCCGGEASIAVAAANANVSLETIVAALAEASRENA
jgi:iron-sulfur cluster repair protein YtfE (RIC family)